MSIKKSYHQDRRERARSVDAPKRPAADSPVLPAGPPTPTSEQEVVIECAWCRKQVGTKRMIVSPGLEGYPTSTICKECMAKFFPKLRTRP